MAQNYLQPGKTWDVATPAGGWTSGQVVLVGVLVGIALLTTNQGDTNEVRLEGVFQGLPKAAGTAWNPGDKLYWDNTAKNFTKTATNNTPAGYAWYGALSGDTAGYVLLKQIS